MTLPLGGPRRNGAIPLSTRKLEWSSYPTVKNFEDIYNRLDRIPTCDGHTGGHLATA